MPIEPPKMIAPARSGQPISLAARQRTLLQMRRRESLRLGLIVGLSVSLATLVVVTASFVGTHLAAMWWFEGHQALVDWDIDDTNWRQGGVTSVSFAPTRRALSSLGDADLDHLHRLHRVVNLDLADTREISDKGLAKLPAGSTS